MSGTPFSFEFLNKGLSWIGIAVPISHIDFDLVPPGVGNSF
jgi:hypothetical protein